jgi:hypothetical protein
VAQPVPSWATAGNQALGTPSALPCFGLNTLAEFNKVTLDDAPGRGAPSETVGAPPEGAGRSGLFGLKDPPGAIQSLLSEPVV